jgi:hypothetical protein
MGIVRRIAYGEKHMELSPEAVAQTKLFFFRAMRRALLFKEGWSESGFLHQEGSLRFEGWLERTDDSKSIVLVWSEVHISFRGIPIWSMRCDGYCRRRDLSLLRRVLLETYGRREFVGGRGQVHYERGSRAYGNRSFPGKFEAFCGSENIHIVPPKGGCVYWVTSLLRYAGGLVPIR